MQSKWHIAVPPFSKTDSSALSDATGSDDKQHAMYDVYNDVGDIDLQPLQPRRYASRLSYYSLASRVILMHTKTARRKDYEPKTTRVWRERDDRMQWSCSWESPGAPWPHNDRWRRLGLGSGISRDYLHPFSDNADRRHNKPLLREKIRSPQSIAPSARGMRLRQLVQLQPIDVWYVTARGQLRRSTKMLPRGRLHGKYYWKETEIR